MQSVLCKRKSSEWRKVKKEMKKLLSLLLVAVLALSFTSGLAEGDYADTIRPTWSPTRPPSAVPKST